MVQHQIPLILDSNPAGGAKNVSSDGSSFAVNYKLNIKIPKDAINITCELHSANVWNSSPNISALHGNNHFIFTTGGTTYDLTIADGLYSLEQLEDTLTKLMVNEGLTGDEINLVANESTQKVVIHFTQAGQSIDFTGSNTVRDILGFDAAVYSSGTGEQFVGAPNVAGFNTLNYFLIKNSLVEYGIPFNSQYKNILGIVNITEEPGSLIAYESSNPVRTPADHLAGRDISTFRTWITSETHEPVQMVDYWSYVLIIRYDTPT